MPKMMIDKSIFINKSPQEVFTKLNDFDHWSPWSPWLIMEPGVKVDVAEDKKFYEWNGDIVGSGNMKITNEKENESIDYDLNFLKPWKSYAKVGFKLKPEGEGTHVTWSMDSSMPFFMFFMKKMMTAFIGMDYERGLKMLKDYVEDGEVHSKLDFKGINPYDGCTYVGVKTSCSIDAMADKMKEDFGKLMNDVDHELVTGPAFSIYHKWDVVKQQTEYTAAVPVKSVPANLPGGTISGTVPKTKVHSIEHTGPYPHIGNAWSAQYSLHRAKKFKSNKKIMPFEVYISNPMEVPENELKTVIHFPVK